MRLGISRLGIGNGFGLSLPSLTIAVQPSLTINGDTVTISLGSTSPAADTTTPVYTLVDRFGVVTVPTVVGSTYVIATKGSTLLMFVVFTKADYAVTTSAQQSAFYATAPNAPANGTITIVDNPSTLGDRLLMNINTAPVDGGSPVTFIWTELNGGERQYRPYGGAIDYNLIVPITTSATFVVGFQNLYGDSTGLSIAAVTPTIAGAGGITTFTHETVTWRTDGTTGTFADGTYWTTGFVDVVDPAFTTGVTRISSTGAVQPDQSLHGAMKNPGNAALYHSGDLSTMTLKQTANHRGTFQGYDSWGPGSNLEYDRARGIAFPQTDNATYVKGVSGGDNFARSVSYLSIVTKMASAPSGGSPWFRPGVAAGTKVLRKQVSDLNMARLPNLTPSGFTPISYATAIDRLKAVQTWQFCYNVGARNVVAFNGGDGDAYGGNYCKTYGLIMLALCYSDLSAPEKVTLTSALVQLAYDIAARIEEGGVKEGNGGHSHGWRPLLVFAAWVLNDDPYFLAFLNDTITGSMESYPGTSIGLSIFGDDTQYGLVSQYNIDTDPGSVVDVDDDGTSNEVNAATRYTQDQLGWPEWSGDAGRRPETWRNDLELDRSNKNATYRLIVAAGQIPFALALRLMGARTSYGNQIYFDYADRHMEARLRIGPLKAGNDVSAWVILAWQADRGTDGFWTPVPIEDATVQIDNVPFDGYVFSTFDNVTATYTLSGTGTPGAAVQARGYHSTTPLAWLSGTVDGAGGWTLSGSIPKASWGLYYQPQARVSGQTATEVLASATFGFGEAPILLGQSEPAHFTSNDGGYTSGTYPPLVADNVTIIMRRDLRGTSVDPFPQKVNGAAIAARAITPAMVAIANMLHRVNPGVKYCFLDACKGGTSFNQLMNDFETERTYEEFEDVLNLYTSGGSEPSSVLWMWYASTSSGWKNFSGSFGPGLVGQNADGTTYDLSTIAAERYNHTFWDCDAAEDAYGRGIFRRDRTKLVVMSPALTINALADPEEFQSSTHTTAGAERGGRYKQLTYPALDAAAAFMSGARLGPMAGGNGPAPHIVKYGDYAAGVKIGNATDIHPSLSSPYGAPMLGMHMAMASVFPRGIALEPRILGTETPAGGAYTDVIVDLPNGGTLSTIRIVRGLATTGTPVSHEQAVMGFEIRRSGGAETTRRPVHRTDAVSYPSTHRGTVTIQDTGTGTVPNRRGKIRITPTDAFATGDVLEFLKGGGLSGQIRAATDYDRDLWDKMPLEHVAAWDDGTSFGYPGVAVRPQPGSLTITLDSGPVIPPVGVTTLTREANGTATVTSVETLASFTLTREVDGTVTVNTGS